MEVPEMVSVLPSIQVEVIFSPGAKRSREAPKFEKSAISSLKLQAPTVITCGTWAGETLSASSASFPAATTMVTPELKS